MKTCVATTPTAGVRPLAYQAVQAASCYAQLSSLLEGRLGREHAAFLAEPQSNAGASEIDWYTAAEGAIRHFSDLPPEEQTQAAARIEHLAQEMASLAAALKAEGDSNSLMAGSLLELALSYPSKDCLYLAGNQPVLVLWGHAQAGMAASPEPLTRLAAGLAAAQVQTVPQPEPAGQPTPAFQAMPSPKPSPVAAATARKPLWWGWLPPFLVGLALCSLLLVALPWLFGASHSFLPGGCSRLPLIAEGGSNKEKNSIRPQQPDPALSPALDATTKLQAELAALQAAYAAKLRACPAQTPEPPVSPRTEQIPPLQPDQPEGQMEPRSLPAPPVAENPPLDDFPLPDPKPEPELHAEAPTPPVKQPEQPKTPEAPKKKMGDKLSIPEGAKKSKDMSFLEGCWLADTGKGVVNARTGWPVAVKFCFNKSGQGTSYVQEHDKNKRLMRECKGPARALIAEDGVLIIDDNGSVTCPDGRKYLAERVHCIDKGGTAICSETLRRRWQSVPFIRTTR